VPEESPLRAFFFFSFAVSSSVVPPPLVADGPELDDGCSVMVPELPLLVP
jgi:hypothetical protein